MPTGIQRTIEIVIRAKNKIGPVLNKVRKGISSFAKGAGKLLGGLAKHVKRLGLVFVGLAAAVSTKAVKSFMKFDDVMRNVWTLIPIGEQAFRDLSDAVLLMSRELPKTPEDLGASLYDIISAGITDTADALMVLEQSAKAAVAGVTDVANASAPAIAIMNAFGKSAADIPAIFDLLFSTIRVGVLRFNELQNAVGTMAASFASAKAPVSEMLGSLAFLTKSGLNAARSATALNRAVGVMIARRKEFERILGVKVFDQGKWRGLVAIVGDLADKLDGMTTEQKLAKIQQLIPQERARKALVSMINNYDAFARVVDQVSDSQGAMNEAAARQLDSLSSKWQLLKNGISEVFIRLGEVLGVFLGPAFKKAQKIVNDLADSIANNRKEVLKWIREISTNLIIAVAKAFNFISEMFDGLSASLVEFRLGMQDMAALFARLEKGKFGLPTFRDPTALEQMEDQIRGLVRLGIRDFGTLAAYVEHLEGRFEKLNDATIKWQEMGKEIPPEIIAQMETLSAILSLINEEFGVMAKMKGPKIDVEELRAKLDEFFDGIEDRENKIRAQAEKPIALSIDWAEFERESKQLAFLLRFSEWPEWRKTLHRAAQGIGDLFKEVSNVVIDIGGKFFGAVQGGLQKAGKFLKAFYKNQAADFGMQMLDKILPTVSLLFEAVEATDPAETIKEWADGAVKFIKALSSNIGIIIDALIDALPEILIALADAIPIVMVKIAEKLPELAILFINVIIYHAPRIAFAIAEGIVRAIAVILLWVIDKIMGGLLRALGFDPRQAMQDVSEGAGSLTTAVFGEAQPLQDGGFVNRGGLFRLHENETVIPAGGAPIKVEVHYHGFIPSGMDRRTMRGLAREIKEETETIVNKRFKE